MPIYEYACNDCGRNSSVFQRRMESVATPVCPHCQSQNLRRLISRFAVVRSAHDAFDDSALAGLDESDPQAMARWARRMSEEMGEDLGPDFEDDLGRMETGEGEVGNDLGGELDDL